MHKITIPQRIPKHTQWQLFNMEISAYIAFVCLRIVRTSCIYLYSADYWNHLSGFLRNCLVVYFSQRHPDLALSVHSFRTISILISILDILRSVDRTESASSEWGHRIIGIVYHHIIYRHICMTAAENMDLSENIHIFGADDRLMDGLVQQKEIHTQFEKQTNHNLHFNIIIHERNHKHFSPHQLCLAKYANTL